MNDTSFNPSIVRFLVIVGLVILSQFLRRKKQPSKPPSKPPATLTGRPSGLDAIREALQQARQQVEQQRPQQSPRPLRSGIPSNPEFSMQVDRQFTNLEQFEAPPAIQPESSFLPTVLLFALFVCLVIMAYQYFA